MHFKDFYRRIILRLFIRTPITGQYEYFSIKNSIIFPYFYYSHNAILIYIKLHKMKLNAKVILTACGTYNAVTNL